MKKRVIGVVVVLMVLILGGIRVKALIPSGVKEAEYYKEPQKVRCTCYIDRGMMAGGQYTRDGAIAGRREWLGKVAALYQIDKETGKIGKFLGYFEFLDTGAGMDTDGDGYGDTIRTGNSVDVWMPSMADARGWIRENGDYVYMQIIDGEG